MNWKSYVLVSGAGVLATYFATTEPSRMPGSVPPELPRDAVGATAAVSDIEQQASRLQARLQHEALYRQPSRDPFRFNARARASAAAPAAAPVGDPAPVAPLVPPPLPPLRLAGVAVDQEAGVEVRTAILSTASGVVLARVGDEVAGRFRVTKVEEDAVELVALSDGAPLRLTF